MRVSKLPDLRGTHVRALPVFIKAGFFALCWALWSFVQMHSFRWFGFNRMQRVSYTFLKLAVETEVHQGPRSQFDRDLCLSGNCEGIFIFAKRCQNRAPGGVGVVPGKSEEPSDEILTLTLSRARCSAFFYLSLNPFNQNAGLGIDNSGLLIFQLSACHASLDGEPYSHICRVLFLSL